MEWKRVRARVIESSSVCHLCGRQLVPDAPPRSRWSTEVDHVVSVKKLQQLDPLNWWHLALDPSNLRAAHQRCNRQKGAKAKVTKPRGQSREWFARRSSGVW
jgi:5-methylcytosine-specific restriction endonuclease McrA